MMWLSSETSCLGDRNCRIKTLVHGFWKGWCGLQALSNRLQHMLGCSCAEQGRGGADFFDMLLPKLLESKNLTAKQAHKRVERLFTAVASLALPLPFASLSWRTPSALRQRPAFICRTSRGRCGCFWPTI